MNLTLAGYDTLRLARRFGLPLHLYEARQITENLRAFQSVFKESENKRPGLLCRQGLRVSGNH